MRYRLPSRP
ncbi:MAG: hypothetical protein HQ522_09075 [Bacteroidetes bacterium]|nr:hypothetical protein [Bacteroidota bacterium]